MAKITQFFVLKMSKITLFVAPKNVENHAIFVEAFWPDFYARGRFVKYSMSGEVNSANVKQALH